MSEFTKIFEISRKSNLREARKRFNNAKTCLDSLKNKNSEYALSVHSLMIAHSKVVEIWENATSQAEDKEKPLDTSEQRL